MNSYNNLGVIVFYIGNQLSCLQICDFSEDIAVFDCLVSIALDPRGDCHVLHHIV